MRAQHTGYSCNEWTWGAGFGRGVNMYMVVCVCVCVWVCVCVCVGGCEPKSTSGPTGFDVREASDHTCHHIGEIIAALALVVDKDEVMWLLHQQRPKRVAPGIE